MARTAANLTITLLLMGHICGCTIRPRFGQQSGPVAIKSYAAEHAPKIELPLNRNSAITTVSNHPAARVSLVDHRPEIEKLYHPGTDDPHHWRDAITVLPMESYQPNVDELLSDCVAKNLPDDMRDREVVCEVTSFQVALDERDRGENDLLHGYRGWEDARLKREEEERQREREEEECRRQRTKFGHEDEEESMAEAIAGLIFEAAVVQPVKSKMTRDEKKRQLAAHPQTISTTLTEGKKSGWNCHISLRLKAQSTTSNPQEQSFAVAVHRPKNDSTPVKQQMQQIVLDAISELGQKIAAGH